jgi:outer membrane protein OmpA-like peptidoglycan-associated protein
MAGLFEEVVGLLESQSSTRALADRFGLANPGHAGTGAVLGVPVVLDGLWRRIADPIGSGQVLELLWSIDRAGLDDPVGAIRTGGYEPIGSQLVNRMLGPARLRVATIIAGETGIAPPVADRLLPVSAWAVVVSLVDRHGGTIDRRSLMGILEGERRALVDGGWGPWMEATGLVRAAPIGPPSALRPEPAAVVRQPATARPAGTPAYPPPLARSARHEGSNGAVPAPARIAALAATTTGPIARPGPSISSALVPVERSADRHLDGGSDRSDLLTAMGWPSYVGVLLLFLLGSVALLLLFTGRDGEVDASSSGRALAPSVDGAAPVDGTGGPLFTASDVEREDDPPSGTVAIDVLMSDVTGSSAATGLAELRFDLDEGQICYNVTSELIDSPYDGHVHVGPAGAQGGIVVDFGALDNRDIGCVPVDRRQIEAILADLDGHYVELHDRAGAFTIRAQLSEGTVVGGSPAANVLSVAAGEDEPGAGFDPDGGGAVAVVEEGRIVLQGAVADRATGDRQVAEFSGVDGLEVVDRLTISAGAPPPYGRIIIDDSALFGLDSDRLSSTAFPVLADLALLLLARPDWKVTVVGHTGSSGDAVDNLELSLRRAEALRDELIDNGVAASRLGVEGAGSTRPLTGDSTSEGRARNGRIEIEIDRTG